MCLLTADKYLTTDLIFKNAYKNPSDGSRMLLLLVDNLADFIESIGRCCI